MYCFVAAATASQQLFSFFQMLALGLKYIVPTSVTSRRAKNGSFLCDTIGALWRAACVPHRGKVCVSTYALLRFVLDVKLM
jgi:hypothetical protein